MRYAIDLPHLDGKIYIHQFDGPDWLWTVATRLRLPWITRVANTIPAWWVDAGFPVEDWCGMQDRGEVGLDWQALPWPRTDGMIVARMRLMPPEE